MGSQASNGVVERGIQSVEGQVRVMKSALEGQWGLKIEAKHAVIPWIMEYASAGWPWQAAAFVKEALTPFAQQQRVRTVLDDRQVPRNMFVFSEFMMCTPSWSA